MRSSSLLLVALTACLCVFATAQPAGVTDAHVRITILHLNDCYELMPTSGNFSLGGVARVETLRKQLKAANPNTFVFLAGDLFSPSALSNTPIPNAQTRNGVNYTSTTSTGNWPNGYEGYQMVAGMNALNVDVACLGNHETDVRLAPFTKNMNFSKFDWVSANAQIFSPYPNLKKSKMIEVAATGNKAALKIGVVGLTIDSNNRTGTQTYAPYANSISIGQNEVNNLNANGANVIVALTHYDAVTDEDLVSKVTGIHIVTGGHEHSVINIQKAGVAPIFKADSNVRTVWVHDLWVNPALAKTDPAYIFQEHRLVTINSTFSDDPVAAAAIKPYVDNAYASFAVAGFNASQMVATLTDDLDLRRNTMASQPVLATRLFAEAILASGQYQLSRATNNNYSSQTVDFAWFNIGTIRLDDIIPKNTDLSQYDVMRVCPFVNKVQVAEISGKLILDILAISEANRFGMNTAFMSQYLAVSSKLTRTAKVAPESGWNYFVNGVALNVNKKYLLAVTDYLVGSLNDIPNAGGPAPYSIMKPANSPLDIKIVYYNKDGDEKADPRIFFIPALTERYPPRVACTNCNPAGDAKVFVRFVLDRDFNSLNAQPNALVRLFLASTPFIYALQTELMQALQVRRERIDIYKLIPLGSQTYVYFTVLANGGVDPFTAEEVVANFNTQMANPASPLRTGALMKLADPASVVASTTTDPSVKDENAIAAGANIAPLQSILALAVIAVVAIMQKAL